jgi:hypothetical protein
MVAAGLVYKLVVGDHVAAADEEIAVILPLQTLVVAGVIIGAAGTGLRLTTVVPLIEHVPLDATNVYVPVVVEVTEGRTGLSKVEVKPPGPVQVYMLPPPPTPPFKVIGLPGHTGPVLVGATVTGHGDHLSIVLVPGNAV